MALDFIVPIVIGLACLTAMALTVVVFVMALNMVDGGGG
jgi:hypothetical protein